MTSSSVFYHAAAVTHEVGQVLRVESGDYFYKQRAAKNGLAWVDGLLGSRPLAKGKPLRTKSVYCCPQIETCAAFAESEPQLKNSYRIYEVLPHGNIHSAPMLLVGRIARRGQPDPIAEAIADEYWHQRWIWRFIEVLADELEVVREVDRPDQMGVTLGKTLFSDDQDLAQRLGW